MPLDVRAREGGVRLSVHVQPRAARSEIAGMHGQALKVRLHAPPVSGAANEALVAFLAQVFALPRRAVRIVSGHTGRAKIVEIDGLDPDAVRRAVGED